ncbi:hypothetical protein A2U01_0040022, partial [Trifolium medium]|nr:hypothetical protein [Trifolium medium]
MRPVNAKQQPHRPPMLQVLIEEQLRNEVVDTFQICQQVSTDIHRLIEM